MILEALDSRSAKSQTKETEGAESSSVTGLSSIRGDTKYFCHQPRESNDDGN